MKGSAVIDGFCFAEHDFHCSQTFEFLMKIIPNKSV